MPIRQFERLEQAAENHDVLFCDVWGVVHNGEWSHRAAVNALKRVRDTGKPVILITNSPRRNDSVCEQMTGLGVPPDAYDRVVTSGDVTRGLIEQAPRRIFHLGPERDASLFDGLDIELCEEFEASAVVCTGLFEDEEETPEDYADMLARLRSRDLPFICANPDIIVERGQRLIWCAGALARDYGLLGGRTLIAGKPHAPIYAAALDAASKVRGSEVDRKRVLAIGDGMLTDVKGAEQNGYDVLYISGGIHARDYGDPGNPDIEALEAFLEKHGSQPIGFMPKLV